MKIFIVKGIKYDTDGQEVSLPESLCVYCKDEDEVVDKISDNTGFLVESVDSIKEVRTKIEDLTSTQLWELREEIVLGSLFANDYKNSFGFSKESLRSFFDGFVEEMDSLAKEFGDEPSTYDTPECLFDYYWNIQDWEWFQYEPEWTEEEEQTYCDYWNGNF